MNGSITAVLPGFGLPTGAVAPGKRISARPVGGRVNVFAPVRARAEVYRKDVVLRVGTGVKRLPRIRERGAIIGFSADSARRLRLLIRNTADLWTGFVTLTYPGPSFGFSPEKMDGPTCKRHIHTFCTWLGRQKIAYVWVLEFQERGVPHFHFCVSGYIDKNKLSRKWYEIVGSCDPRHLAAGTRVDGVKNPDQVGGYIGAYVSKMDQKTVPAGFEKVGRFWGASRCLSKIVYEMDGLYEDVSRELRPLRARQVASRREMVDSQTATANARFNDARAAEDDGRKRKLLAVGRSCLWRAGSYAKRWKWKGFGFTLINGAGTFRSLLRQAVGVDAHKDGWTATGEWLTRPVKGGGLEFSRRRLLWQVCDGTGRDVRKYVSPEERLKNIGQLLLTGAIDPEDGLADCDIRRQHARRRKVLLEEKRNKIGFLDEKPHAKVPSESSWGILGPVGSTRTGEKWR